MKKFNSVFVIDDDLVFHLIMKKLFAKSDLNVNTKYFFNGNQAIEDLKGDSNSAPDLILLDINMPVCDGWQFLDEFKKIKSLFDKEITVYLVSSSNDASDKDKAKEYLNEIKAFYNKPMTIESFEKIFG